MYEALRRPSWVGFCIGSRSYILNQHSSCCNSRPREFTPMSSNNSSTTLLLPGSDVNNFTFSSTSTVVVGWASGPNSRGTIDIIWGSFLTIFLCRWTAICLNIPHPDDTNVHVLLRKAKWMFWAIVGPELVLSVAIGQHASARRSVRRFKRLGCSTWTLRHAFFADMGGILLKPRDSTPFLVNSRQLAYLVQQKYTECPTISAGDIWDKSKADTMTKVLTLAQASWLAVQLCGRAIQHLPTTTLELSAAAIVFCTIGTLICWLRKPSDVQKGIVLSIDATTKEMLLDAGDAASKLYRHTPLDFVAKESFTISYDVMRLFNMSCDNPERPLRRFPDDRFPDISTVEKLALFCMTQAYAAFHLIGWDFYFPSRTELILWRVSSLVVTCTTWSFWVFKTIAARQRFGRWDKYLIWLRLKRGPHGNIADPETKLDRDDAFEQEQQKSRPILWWEVALILPVALVYIAARAYMVAEVFVSLRKLPLGAYKTVSIVSQIFPHW